MPTPKQIDTPDTGPPDNPPSPEVTASKLGVIAALCFLPPVLYFLSIGPAYWALVNGYLPSDKADIVNTFYWPIFYLSAHSEPFQWLFIQYIALWVDFLP